MNKEDVEKEKYEFEKNLSYQRLHLLLGGDIRRKNQIQAICERVSISPIKLSYLDNLLFHVQSLNHHAIQFKSKYIKNKKQIKKYIEKICEESEKDCQYLIKGRSYIPIDSQFEFVSFISSVKNALESALRFFVFFAFREDFKRKLSPRRFYKALKNENKDMNNINKKIKNKYPELRNKYFDEWNKWIKDLNEIRDDYEHLSSAAGNVLDIKATTGMKNKGLVVNLIFKDDKTSVLLYVNDIQEKCLNFINYIFNYMERNLEKSKDNDFKKVIEYFTELNNSPYFSPPSFIGHKYELSTIYDEDEINKIIDGEIPFTKIIMIDKEDE